MKAEIPFVMAEAMSLGAAVLFVEAGQHLVKVEALRVAAVEL